VLSVDIMKNLTFTCSFFSSSHFVPSISLPPAGIKTQDTCCGNKTFVLILCFISYLLGGKAPEKTQQEIGHPPAIVSDSGHP
jgi:hypothetical protein